ncbi:MAG: hypothetical protein EAX86_11800 [Candidatus Heimdallarchaeota archaeon]|nr:hypothetical protein [Candidatus Heimdallarchaeota archaeon]
MTMMQSDNGGMFTYIHKKADVTITEPAVIIQGLPGMGLIGKIAVNFLIKEFKAIEVARVYSSFFPPVVQIDSKTGVGRLSRMEIYIITATSPNIILLTGDAQPHDIGIIQVLNNVLDFLMQYKADTLICLGGLRAHDDGPEIAGFGYNEETTNWLQEHEIELLKGGEVTGAVGVLSALGAERNMRSFGLLGKLTLAGADPIASKNILKKLGELYNLNFDLKDLESSIKEAQEKNERLASLAQDFLEPEDSGEDPGYYI